MAQNHIMCNMKLHSLERHNLLFKRIQGVLLKEKLVIDMKRFQSEYFKFFKSQQNFRGTKIKRCAFSQALLKISIDMWYHGTQNLMKNSRIK